MSYNGRLNGKQNEEEEGKYDFGLIFLLLGLCAGFWVGVFFLIRKVAERIIG